MEGNFGEFGESSMIRQTITIQISAIINNLSADLSIRQIFFCEMLETSQFAKIYPRQSFPPYGSYKDIHYKDGFCREANGFDRIRNYNKEPSCIRPVYYS